MSGWHELAQIGDVVVEGAGADAEQLGDRGDAGLGVGQHVAGGAEQFGGDDGGAAADARPRARAAARPSRVPEMMSSRMNSARAAKTWKTSRPPGVVVSRFSCRLVNPTPRRRRSATTPIRSCRERESRSRAGTTRVSPGCMNSRQAASSGRSVSRPDSFSAKVRRHPGSLEGVELAFEVLPAGGDPRVSDLDAGHDGRLGNQKIVGGVRRARHAPNSLNKRRLEVIEHGWLLNEFLKAWRVSSISICRSSGNDGFLKTCMLQTCATRNSLRSSQFEGRMGA
jgi:hypothetical protein